MSFKKGVSVIIPNWNGKELLNSNLPALLNALKIYGGESEIIIVDDGSDDGSAEFVQDSYPRLRLVRFEKNRGFIEACNIGARESNHAIIYFLNSDIEVEEGFLEPLSVLFKNEKVFAVSGKALMPDKKTFLSGASGLRFKWGLTWISRDIDEARINKTSLNFRASGGHSAFDREKFLKLGGFDSLFRPFYCEDEDICYRAWKTGWLVLYEPKSIVFHQPQSTIGKAFKKGQIESIMRRNRFLFIWKNIFDKKLLFKHLFFLPFQLIMAPIVGRYRFTLAFFMALSRLEEVVNKRRHEDVHQLKDSDVIDRLSSLQRIEDAQV